MNLRIKLTEDEREALKRYTKAAEDRVLLYREVGRLAFLMLDEESLGPIITAAAKGRGFGYMINRNAYERETEAIAEIYKGGITRNYEPIPRKIMPKPLPKKKGK